MAALLLGVAFVCLAVPVFTGVRWIAIATRAGITHAEAVAAFLQIFPEPLRDPSRVTWVSVAFGVVAVVLAWRVIRIATAVLKTIGYLVILFAALLVAWNLFTLM